MIARLAWRGIASGKARFACAAAGVAVAVGAVAFTASLARSVRAQAPALAAKAMAELPVPESTEVLACTVDARPGGRVLQGPPMRALLAIDPTIGGTTPQVVITRALFDRRMPEPPAVGERLTFVGRHGALTAEIVRSLPFGRRVRGLPNAFVNEAAAKAFAAESWRAYEPPSPEAAAAAFETDDRRNFDRSRVLLLWAAALTALCLLVNSLLLSVEANRRTLALLRTTGLTRGGVARLTLLEAFGATATGVAFGLAGAWLALVAWTAADPGTFPAGWRMAWNACAWCALAAPGVALLAALVALRPACAVRPLDATSWRPPAPKRAGMVLSFAFGFGAFVAVETWGTSLMGSFVPSPEWPDAIVSLLPGGVSGRDALKSDRLPGVRWIGELAPRQVPFEPLEEMAGGAGGGRGGRRAYENALVLASDRLPRFAFSEGDSDAAEKAVFGQGACVITAMMARARNLKKGDRLKLNARGAVKELPIAGVVDLNWHLVTSRGLLRGLNGMPGVTSGPVFVSFDTLNALDPRPERPMTHLWLCYEPSFLARHGVFAAGRLVEREIADALFGADGHAVAVRLHARDEIADGTLAHGNDVVGTMARVPFVFLVVLSLGFVAMLVGAADARRREFAVLRAVGATRGQLAMRLVGDAARVAALGLALGLAGGALAGWLFTFGTRAAMARWGLPPSFALPVGAVAKGALGALVSALAVAIPTALALVGGGRK